MILVCVANNEVLRFKASDIGLVPAIADNFDASITSLNGLKSTHVLALLMTQVCPNNEDSQEDTKIKQTLSFGSVKK